MVCVFSGFLWTKMEKIERKQETVDVWHSGPSWGGVITLFADPVKSSFVVPNSWPNYSNHMELAVDNYYWHSPNNVGNGAKSSLTTCSSLPRARSKRRVTCRLAYVVESTSHVVEAALERNAVDTRRPADLSQGSPLIETCMNSPAKWGFYFPHHLFRE